jgi:AraC-like DNA-binding protein
MHFNIYNSLILAGVIQGIIFGLVVPFSERYKAKSTLFLVALIVSYSLGNLQYLLPDIGKMSLQYMYSFVYLPLASIMAPLFYFYVTFFIDPDRKHTRFEKLLFLPFLVFLVITIVFRILIIFNVANGSMYPIFKTIIDIHEIFSIGLTIAVLTVVLYKLYAFEKMNDAYKVEHIRPQLKWLKLTIGFIYILTILWAYLTFINLVYPERYISYYSLWLGLAASIYWLGHIGIYKFGINNDRIRIRKYSLEKYTPVLVVQSKNEHIKAFEHLLIHEKVYLDSKLSLEIVASNLEISPSHLSRTINNELGTSFSDYVNGLRIETAKNYLENPEFSNYTMISIGLEAGFNSKSAFFDVFKKATGKTPSAYQKENKKYLKKKAS